MKKEILEVNGRNYLVKIHTENRDGTRVSISRNAINIRLPDFLNREDRFKEILKMKMWAKSQLEKSPDKFTPKPQKEYQDGEILNVGDEEFTIKIDYREKQSSSARIRDNIIYLVVSSNYTKEIQNNHISSLISRCIANKRSPTLKKKILQLNDIHFKQQINKIFFKNLKTKWGSCSKAGNINISTRLLFAPDDVLEYVCIHELAHLIEHNHSDKFWALVANTMPDYKEKEKWLKQHGSKCVF